MRWIYEDEYIDEDPRSMDHSLCGTHTYLSTKGSVYVFNVLEY